MPFLSDSRYPDEQFAYKRKVNLLFSFPFGGYISVSVLFGDA